MKTGKQVAIFDCRQYNAKLPKEQWRVVADSETVTLTIIYPKNELPEMFTANGQPDEFVRLYASKTERENASHENRQPTNDRAAVRFKVGANCKWFDKFGKATTRPTNAELDGKRYEVNVDFSRKARSLTDRLAPCGYWANAIMFKELEENPFAGEEFEKDENPSEEAEPADRGYVQYFDDDTKPAAAAAVQAPASDDDDDDIPFL